MSDIGPLYVGRSLLRREDRRLLRGQGQFIADLVLPRMLHAVLVRSPVAHAGIRSVDLSRAAQEQHQLAAPHSITPVAVFFPLPSEKLMIFITAPSQHGDGG